MVIISLVVVVCYEWPHGHYLVKSSRPHGHYLVRSGRLWPASWSLSR